MINLPNYQDSERSAQGMVPPRLLLCEFRQVMAWAVISVYDEERLGTSNVQAVWASQS